jgi:hypothetical protein
MAKSQMKRPAKKVHGKKDQKSKPLSSAKPKPQKGPKKLKKAKKAAKDAKIPRGRPRLESKVVKAEFALADYTSAFRYYQILQQKMNFFSRSR